MLATRADEAGKLRLALLGLAALSLAGAIAELAMERHWNGFIKLIPWFAVAAVFAGLLLVLIRPNRLTIWFARGICVAVTAATLFGIYEHINENHKAGALDFRYAD
ncbi:MAG: hypothetical protein ABI577_18135, partial [bacterium]